MLILHLHRAGSSWTGRALLLRPERAAAACPGAGRDTAAFRAADASGNTSQAAGIQEALELGAAALLLDEDTCATNFMIRDARMQARRARSGLGCLRCRPGGPPGVCRCGGHAPIRAMPPLCSAPSCRTAAHDMAHMTRPHATCTRPPAGPDTIELVTLTITCCRALQEQFQAPPVYRSSHGLWTSTFGVCNTLQPSTQSRCNSQALVAKDKEPITPFIARIRALAASGMSVVIVMGGSGDYFGASRGRPSACGWAPGVAGHKGFQQMPPKMDSPVCS